MSTSLPSAPVAAASSWPEPPRDWDATRDTVQLLAQVVGKVRMVCTPLARHWWNVPLYVTARGFTSSLVHHPTGGGFEMEFDLRAHELVVTTTRGAVRRRPLTAEPVADFHAGVLDLLADLGLAVDFWPVPVEIPDAVPFPDDTVHASYDREQVERFWQVQVQAHRVFELFAARFLGKVSPVHLFWGALDLAVTRFSGRTAPAHPGGAPNCGPAVMHEAYSHEVSSAGFWPGGPGGGLFYSYAYPEPAGFRTAAVRPAAARFDEALGEYVLSYDDVRSADDPDAALLEFLQSTYEAAAVLADWDRAALERPGS